MSQDTATAHRINPITEQDKLKEAVLEELEQDPKPISTAAKEMGISDNSLYKLITGKKIEFVTAIKIRAWLKKIKN